MGFRFPELGFGSRVSGLRFLVPGFRIRDSVPGIRIPCSRFRGSGFGFWVSNFGIRVSDRHLVDDRDVKIHDSLHPRCLLRFLRFRGPGLALQVSCLVFRVSCVRFQVPVFGSGVWGSSIRVSDFADSQECCPPRQKSSVERLNPEVEPLSIKVTVDSCLPSTRASMTRAYQFFPLRPCLRLRVSILGFKI